ncbi:Putative sensor [Natronorubrum sediminis]|uniref:Putative sensor n=1 Tax=Natronorubrum sediminis TaxID=640943 RepID=A0A1H6FRC0_9EURY|nr:sensor domain-containing protein [Natronorubrum sediminis]SEH12413.1 Putative sensor [Natronorubrum sediminis]
MGNIPGPISASDSVVRSVFGIVLEAQTYKNVVYLLLAFPLGFVYAMFVWFGFIFGLVLSVVVVGFGILLATVFGTRLLARFERWLANALLSLELRAPSDRPQSGGLWETTKGMVDAPSTWRNLGFVTLKFWFGFVGFLLVAFLVSSIELLFTPLRYPTAVEFGTVNDQPVVWTIETLPEALVAVPVGVLATLVLLHVSNGVAYVAKRKAIALLGPVASSEEPDNGSEEPHESAH